MTRVDFYKDKKVTPGLIYTVGRSKFSLRQTEEDLEPEDKCKGCVADKNGKLCEKLPWDCLALPGVYVREP